MLKGDLGLFRGALLLSGFFQRSESSMFNDNHKDGSRRLKLWFADAVFDAPQKQQRELEHWLREAFGDRILSMYFTAPRASWYPRSRALCIQLKD
jgi:hypothetical protein